MVNKVTPLALSHVFKQFQPVSKTTKVALAALGLFVLGLAVISYLHKRMVTDGTRSEGSDRRDGVDPGVVTDGTRLGGSDRRDGVDTGVVTDGTRSGGSDRRDGVDPGVVTDGTRSGGSDRRDGVDTRVGDNGFLNVVNDYFKGGESLSWLIRRLGKEIRPEYTVSNVTPEAILNGIHAYMAQVSPLQGIVPGNDHLGNKFIYVTYGRIRQRQNRLHIVVFSMKQRNGEIDWYIGTIGPSSSKPPVIKPFFGEEAAHTKDLLKSLIRGSHREYRLVSTNPSSARGSVGVPGDPLNPCAILTKERFDALPSLPISQGKKGETLETRVYAALERILPPYPIMKGIDEDQRPFTVFIYIKRGELLHRRILIYGTENGWKAYYNVDIKSQDLAEALRQLVADTHPALKLIDAPAQAQQKPSPDIIYRLFGFGEEVVQQLPVISTTAPKGATVIEGIDAMIGLLSGVSPIMKGTDSNGNPFLVAFFTKRGEAVRYRAIVYIAKKDDGQDTWCISMDIPESLIIKEEKKGLLKRLYERTHPTFELIQ